MLLKLMPEAKALARSLIKPFRSGGLSSGNSIGSGQEEELNESCSTAEDQFLTVKIMPMRSEAAGFEPPPRGGATICRLSSDTALLAMSELGRKTANALIWKLAIVSSDALQMPRAETEAQFFI
jgi:hypothetical protein